MRSLLVLLQPLGKPLFVTFYLGLGGFLLSAAQGLRLPRISFPRILAVLIVGIAVSQLWVKFTVYGGPLYLAAVSVGTGIFAFHNGAWKSPRLMAAAVAANSLTVSLAFWLAKENPSTSARLLVFALVAYYLQEAFLSVERPVSRSFVTYSSLVFGITGLLLLVDLTPYQRAGRPLIILFHHYGAYIGSALHLRAGLIPFYDVPLIYGLGPTLTIAGACQFGGCWAGMQFLAVISKLAMGLLVLLMALSTSTTRGPRWIVAATFVVFTAVFFWSGFPDIGSLPASSPSGGGMRFLPMVLVAFFLFFERPGLAAVALVPAVLWSPEVACMALAVFGIHETARLGFWRATRRAALIAGGAFLGMIVVHRLVYGVWIQPGVFAEYIIHVPTPLPIDWSSSVFFLMAVFGLAAWNVGRSHTEATAFRRDLVAASLLFGSTSYYLGQSHPNSVCFAIPFVVLVAFRTLDGLSLPGHMAMNRMAVIALSIVAATGALSSWHALPSAREFEVNPNSLFALAETLDPGIKEARSRILNPENVGIADFPVTLNLDPVEPIIFTPMEPLELWVSVPSDRRRLYIRRSAARLRRPGWVVIGHAELGLIKAQRDLLDDFRAGYRITEQSTMEVKSPIPGATPKIYIVAHLIPLDGIPEP